MSEQKTKVPGHFFQWFESLKQGYENSINRLFNRVEAVNEENRQQLNDMYHLQIDALKKSYQDHLHSLKDSHSAQLQQSEARIRQLEKDAQFYQQQVKLQHQTIDRLNTRYDAVIFAITDKMDSKELENVIKDISPAINAEQDKPSLQNLSHENPADTEENLSGPLAPANRKPFNPLSSVSHIDDDTNAAADQSDTTEQVQQSKQDAEPQTETQNLPQIMQNAFDARQDQQFETAFELFMSAAKAGNAKAMGAIGRAYFVGEGVATDRICGLAWLIIAADHGFEPAIKKVTDASQKSPELFAQAQQLATEISQQ